MDLIHIILSVLLRLSPAVRKVSKVTRSSRQNGHSSANRKHGQLTDLAFWIPLVGWISVSVQFVPNARWLQWRVVSVHSFGERHLDFEDKEGWKNDTLKRNGGKTPPDHHRRR